MFDSTIAIRRDPYRFISRACREAGRDWVTTRLLLEPVVCVTGRDAAGFVYNNEHFRRRDAAPNFLKATLFGSGGVQGLDGAAHRQRKAQFLEVLGPDRVPGFAEQGAREVARALASPGGAPLQDRAEDALTRAALDWVGVPAGARRFPGLPRRIADLFEHAAPPGLAHLRARGSRRRLDRWAAGLIETARRGEDNVSPDSVLAEVAKWTDADGRLLQPHVAGVELLNIIRPYVAISAYLTFLARQLALAPEWRERLANEPDMVAPFVDEVRRTAPFFPMLSARTSRAETWHDCEMPEGRLVLLDIYGTNRDPEIWDEPETFDPERFRGGDPGPLGFIPQGGDSHATGHRCAGEWVTRDLMCKCVPVLLDGIDWANLPDQDLDFDLDNLPALPRERFRLPQLS